MKGPRKKPLILAIGVTVAVLAVGCQQAAPTTCYEVREYRVFIPTPQEICPDPQKVFEEFRLRRKDFNERYRGASPTVLERAFLDEVVGIPECIEAWAEKWTTVKCDNQECRCLLPGCLDQWTCDNAAIPLDKLPDVSGLPFYLSDNTEFFPCGEGNCIGGEQTDGEGIDIF